MNGSCSPAFVSTAHGIRVLYGWLQAKEKFPGMKVGILEHDEEVCCWKLPAQGFAKCNSDVVVFQDEGIATIGLVLRGYTGSLLLPRRVCSMVWIRLES